MHQTPLTLGITGNIGSGKSTVARLLMDKGAALIDSDALAKQATQDPEVLAAIATKVSPDLVFDGQLDRQKTANVVFNDPEALATLNGIIHPWVRKKSAQRLESLKASDTPPPVVLMDIPLLYEAKLEHTVEAVLVVNAPLDVRIERVKARSGLSETDIRARDAAQLPLEDKVARADYVIHNNAGLDGLERQVDALWSALISQ